MANLPQSIQAQLEEAQRIEAQLTETQGEAPENPESATPNVEENPPPDPQQIAPEEPPAEAPPGKPATDPEETWEQRYRSLMGMYNAEVPRLHAQTKELNTQVQVLVSELEQTKAKQAELQQVPAITDEDREAFGPDLVNLIERAADSKVQAMRQREASLEAEITALKSQLGDISQRQIISDKDRFFSELSRQVPNWEAINVDQGFLVWLQQVDPVYGVARQQALNQAYEQFNSERVAAVFKAYTGVVNTPQTARINPELRRQVAPSTSRVSAPPVESGSSKIYSQGEIQEFYNDWRRGYITDDEAARIERDIHAAAAEGRIR
jgi:hypothetical protein